MLDQIKTYLTLQISKFLKLLGVDPKSDFFKYTKEFSPFLVFMIISNTLALLAVAMLLPFGFKIISTPILGILIGLGFLIQMFAYDIVPSFVNKYGYSTILKIAMAMLFLASFMMIFELNVFMFIIITLLTNISLVLLLNANNGFYKLYTPSVYHARIDIFRYVSIGLAGLIFLGIANLPSFLVGLLFLVVVVFSFVLLLLGDQDDTHTSHTKIDYLSYIKDSLKQINYDNYLKSGLGSRVSTIYFVLAVSMQDVGMGTQINKVSFFINFLLMLGGTIGFIVFYRKQDNKDIDHNIGLVLGIIMTLVISGFIYFFASMTLVIIVGIVLLITNIILSKKK